MKTLTTLALCCGFLGSVSPTFAHNTVRSTQHHNYIHKAAEQVASGETSAKKATEEMLANPEFRKQLEDDVKVHAQQIKAGS